MSLQKAMKRRPGAPAPFTGRKSRLFVRSEQKVRTRNSHRLGLRKPLRSGGLRKRPAVPRFWRSLTLPLAKAVPVPEYRLNLWLLVLAAKKIPHRYFPSGHTPRLYVPPLQEGIALHEIRAVEAERPIPVFVPPARNNLGGVIFFLLLLLAWHGLRWNWFGISLPSPPFPDSPRAWSAAFGLDMYRFRALHEFWRAVTALTLHADDSHLFNNLIFGFLFLAPLCRRAGLGLGLALTVLAGISGNACNTFVKDANVISIGFSTALFGAVGALCGLTAADIFRHTRRFSHMAAPGGNPLLIFARRMFLPLAAGMALLGILGGGGEAKTDYSAHILGFCCGFLITLAALPLEAKIFSLEKQGQGRAQGLLLFSVIAFIAANWLYALQR